MVEIKFTSSEYAKSSPPTDYNFSNNVSKTDANQGDKIRYLSQLDVPTTDDLSTQIKVHRQIKK